MWVDRTQLYIGGQLSSGMSDSQKDVADANLLHHLEGACERYREMHKFSVRVARLKAEAGYD